MKFRKNIKITDMVKPLSINHKDIPHSGLERENTFKVFIL